MNDLLEGMVRRPDHATSIKAAGKVRKFTLRETVEQYARDVMREGFIDDDLKAAWPGKPESSLRKRRTELAQENRILDTGLTRTNRFGHEEIVWVHRNYHPSPPPMQERDTAPKQSRLARAEALTADLLDMVALALPYVEEAIEEPHHWSDDGAKRINALARRMRAAVEAN